MTATLARLTAALLTGLPLFALAAEPAPPAASIRRVRSCSCFPTK